MDVKYIIHYFICIGKVTKETKIGFFPFQITCKECKCRSRQRPVQVDRRTRRARWWWGRGSEDTFWQECSRDARCLRTLQGRRRSSFSRATCSEQSRWRCRRKAPTARTCPRIGDPRRPTCPRSPRPSHTDIGLGKGERKGEKVSFQAWKQGRKETVFEFPERRS